MEIKAGNWYRQRTGSTWRYFLVTILDPAILAPALDVPAGYTTATKKLHVTLRHNADNSVQPEWMVFENLDWAVPAKPPGSLEVGMWFTPKDRAGGEPESLRIERFYAPEDGVGQRIVRLGAHIKDGFSFPMMSERSLRTFYVMAEPPAWIQDLYNTALEEARKKAKDLE